MKLLRLIILLLLVASCSGPPNVDVEGELAGVCDLLGVRRESVAAPAIVWLDDSETVKLYRSEFGVSNKNKVIAFYGVRYNAIYISVPDYRREVLWHELAHAVMCQAKYYSSFSPEQHERMAKLVELAMASYKR